jgi:hypothetical protein
MVYVLEPLEIRNAVSGENVNYAESSNEIDAMRIFLENFIKS